MEVEKTDQNVDYESELRDLKRKYQELEGDDHRGQIELRTREVIETYVKSLEEEIKDIGQRIDEIKRAKIQGSKPEDEEVVPQLDIEPVNEKAQENGDVEGMEDVPQEKNLEEGDKVKEREKDHSVQMDVVAEGEAKVGESVVTEVVTEAVEMDTTVEGDEEKVKVEAEVGIVAENTDDSLLYEKEEETKTMDVSTDIFKAKVAEEEGLIDELEVRKMLLI
ncbi:hypothetical protein AX774_g5932 [Zancudomyces culisetae]|uniref:Uncharacterized protein n=1 Tax=Zancudomyces culisetae TaxID=1213189 RepID=A0A1R1PI43_ZANCU|nr:hypothetical protein AX774_g5932 [Zancudomyces culisetae]|eukprot:OMH80626.1 hypothetical protein AX774_g5932 [Zancudomyces culisetae]